MIDCCVPMQAYREWMKRFKAILSAKYLNMSRKYIQDGAVKSLTPKKPTSPDHPLSPQRLRQLASGTDPAPAAQPDASAAEEGPTDADGSDAGQSW